MNFFKDVNTIVSTLAIVLMWYGICDALYGIKKEIIELKDLIKEIQKVRDKNEIHSNNKH